ncbi:hypothetical protein ACJX0J_024941, partial [Zea mays]
ILFSIMNRVIQSNIHYPDNNYIFKMNTHHKQSQIVGVLEEYLDYKRQHNDKLLDQAEGCDNKEDYCIGKCDVLDLGHFPYKDNFLCILFLNDCLVTEIFNNICICCTIMGLHSGGIFKNFYFYLSKFAYNLFSISMVEKICLFDLFYPERPKWGGSSRDLGLFFLKNRFLKIY